MFSFYCKFYTRLGITKPLLTINPRLLYLFSGLVLNKEKSEVLVVQEKNLVCTQCLVIAFLKKIFE